MIVGRLTQESTALILARKKSSKDTWKPMSQIRVRNLEDALDQVSKRSDIIDR